MDAERAQREVAREPLTSPCPATPEQEEGPYYWQLPLERRDITEARPGVPVQLQITVTDTECTPVPGAAVDIWHCDALGTYSWYAAAGDDDEHDTIGPAPGTSLRGCEGAGLAAGTFLRGWQRSDSDGVCRFQTIYPGWYPGRAVHIHVKVHHAGDVLTTQLYFPDELTDAVYQRDPYRHRPPRDTSNADDVIYRDGGETTTLSPTANDDGYTAAFTLTVG